jgi:hypothetical protein
MGVNAQTAVPAFTAGQVLTAAQMTQVNTGIPVFADTTARDAAFGGAGEKVLAEGQYAYIEASNATQYYDGSAWIGLGTTVAMFNETQTSGTNGGSSSAAWTKRTLNTTVVNEISGCSIASSVITLGAGTYDIYATAPGYSAAEFKLKLRNTTAGTDAIIGSSERNGVGTGVGTVSIVQGRITPTGSTNYELQMYCVNAAATVGFGVASGLGVSEIYAQIKIEKVA